MKERPILFSSSMVRAIIDSRKTMTRRVCKHEPMACRLTESNKLLGPESPHGNWPNDLRDWWLKAFCPYGTVGDRLVPLTTWAVHRKYDSLKPTELSPEVEIHSEWSRATKPLDFGKLRPGRFLPLFLRDRLPRLEITGVRVERLQDITPEDAIAEGCCPHEGNEWDKPEVYRKAAEMVGGPYPRGVFASLWDEINGAGSWASNPWVWVVSFKRAELERTARRE